MKIADSPVKGKWEAYRCEECNYVWRSTEDVTDIVKKVEYWRETVVRCWSLIRCLNETSCTIISKGVSHFTAITNDLVATMGGKRCRILIPKQWIKQLTMHQ